MKCKKCEDANDPEKLRSEIESLRKKNAKAEDDAARLRDGIGDLGRWLVLAGLIDALSLDDAEDFDGGNTRRRIATVKNWILTPNA
jgi:hypothetical protein